MRRFDRILCFAPDEGNLEDALDATFNLARDHKAGVEVVCALDAASTRWFHLVRGINVEELRTSALRERENQLTQQIQPWIKKAECSVSVVWGRPAIEIVRHAIRSKSDLMVIPELPGTAEDDLLAMEILRTSPIPVWRSGAPISGKPPRVLATVDPFHFGDDRNRMDHDIMDVARTFEEFFSAELHVLHVWQMFSESGARFPSISRRADIDRVLFDLRDRHRAALDAVVEDTYSGLPTERVHLREGNITQTIVDFVTQNEIGLLVMGSLHSVETPGYFVGATAEKVLRRVGCSVVTLKPEQFVSPVQLAPTTLGGYDSDQTA